MRSNTPRQERLRKRKEENRLFILGAAERVFARRGFSLASVDDIAAEAGFSKATLYKYFKSKKEIFLTIITNSVAEAEENLLSIGKSGQSASEKLRRYILFVMEYYRGKENFIRIFFLEKQALIKLLDVDLKGMAQGTVQHPPLPKDIEVSMLRISRIMEDILAEGIASGEFRRVDVAAASQVLGAAIRGFQLRGPLPSPPLSPEESAALILDYFLHGVAARDA